MQKQQEDFGYWAGWIVAFGLAGVLFIYVVLQNSTLRDYACKPEETDCFRQWLSALGGWTAAAVAVPTILYLARQINSAERQHRITTALELQRLRAVSRHVIDYSVLVRKHAQSSIKKIEDHQSGVKKMTHDVVSANITTIKLRVVESHFLSFERDVHTAKQSVTFLKAQIDYVLMALSKLPADGMIKEPLSAQIKRLYEAIDTYAEAMSVAASIYLTNTSEFDVDILKQPHP